MFTGIVEELGTVEGVQDTGLALRAKTVLQDVRLGDSICVNGVCLTVTEVRDGIFSVDTVPETRRRSNLGELRPGDRVNLERALQLSGRLGGHLVQGHIEGTGRIESVSEDGAALDVAISAEPSLMRYIVPKGFIAVDGTSLTVVNRDQQGFSVTIIPVTQEWTTLGRRRPGDRVNLETDIVARYIEQLVADSGQRQIR